MYLFYVSLQNESGVQALTIEKTNVTQQLHEMSVEEKIGQMLMIDFNQTVGSGQIGVNASIIRVIDQIQPGGIIFLRKIFNRWNKQSDLQRNYNISIVEFLS